MIGLTVVGNPAATVITSSPARACDRRARRSKARKRSEIGRGAGIDQRGTTHPHKRGEFAFELRGKSSRSEPRVERGFDQQLNLDVSKTLPETGMLLSPATNAGVARATS